MPTLAESFLRAELADRVAALGRALDHALAALHAVRRQALAAANVPGAGAHWVDVVRQTADAALKRAGVRPAVVEGGRES